MSSVIDRFTEEGSAASIEKAKLDREAVVAELDALIAHHEWFSAARMIRRLVSGEEDEALELVLHARGASSLALTKVDSATLTAMTDDDIIERFLSVGDYRIVAEQGDSDATPDVALAAVLDAEDEYVSEDLAEIYLSHCWSDSWIIRLPDYFNLLSGISFLCSDYTICVIWFLGCCYIVFLIVFGIRNEWNDFEPCNESCFFKPRIN